MRAGGPDQPAAVHPGGPAEIPRRGQRRRRPGRGSLAPGAAPPAGALDTDEEILKQMGVGPKAPPPAPPPLDTDEDILKQMRGEPKK